MVFEGVVILEGTRSAMPARKRITNEDEMGSSEGGIRRHPERQNNFGPSRRPASAYLSRILRGLEQKLKRGAPIGIQAMGKRYSYLRRSWGRFFILWLADFTP
jgi:hypothetical protein